MKITTQKAATSVISTILEFMNDYYKIEKIEFHKNRSRKAIKYLLEHEDIGSLVNPPRPEHGVFQS